MNRAGSIPVARSTSPPMGAFLLVKRFSSSRRRGVHPLRKPRQRVGKRRRGELPRVVPGVHPQVAFDTHPDRGLTQVGKCALLAEHIGIIVTAESDGGLMLVGPVGQILS